ncbi:tumor necrosis factor receptor superfamily member 10A-like isoform X3 [Ammospiza caudacuta]|uniref:tumor necrosis factor receptor superfamily member 10A-like isoform X3 n=1 Tax=Ammospiza caudacuta TaxID=2857398 RepID=UPI00273834BD|nr:tumor necrosis factor receptor superfamily member 10A-like isoform X3 [Ammospiza caudacuta]
MRWHRRGWLWLCLAAPLLLPTQAAPWEASAVALRKRDSLDSLDLRWEDDYYRKSDGVYCKKCPAGTHLIKECEEQGGSSTCEPCGLGEYMEYPNTFPSCQECSKCREDQVELSPCQPQRNTVCACRNGTFCPPEHPCEMCQKCQPRCPDGQVVLKPCTPTSDLQCGPDTATFPSYLTGGIIAGIVIATGIGIVIGIAVCCCCKHHCSSPGDRSPSSKTPFEIFQKLWWCKSKRENSGREDNIPNERTERERHERAAERQEMLPSKSERPWRTLVPPPGTEPIKALRDTFYTFAEKVPMDYWRRFGLKLNLQDIDIPMGRSPDDFYNMMCRWHNRVGSKASVNTLLDTLELLKLGGVAENLCKTLVQEQGFQYETS